jgi:DNA repair exonuclease SbcCD nuclease subunit
MEGYATNFPVSRDAPQKRGLDYLAIGDWHSFREIPEGAIAPIVYPSAPEPTKFGEPDSGYVALVWFTRHGIRPRIQRERVARWTWRDVTIRSLAELKALGEEDLVSTVLRLTLDLTVTVPEMKEVEQIIDAFKGTEAANPRTGAFVYDRSKLRLTVGNGSPPESLPLALRETWTRLTEDARASEDAGRAIIILQRLLTEVP